MTRPLAIDLYCGLGGWSEALLAEGYDVVGFDIEQHVYGEHRYPGSLVIQDVRTLHGSQFKDAALIVASPPCQEYSYMAMPWTKAKAKAKAIRADTTGKMLADLTCLFDTCFRLQAQASLAAGQHIPLIVENVRGAQPWVGRSAFNFGSFHFWGDVPALMPIALRSGYKSSGMNWNDRTRRGQDFTRIAGNQAIKNGGGSWFKVSHNNVPHSRGDFVRDPMAASSGTKRKAASAMIAKIPPDVAIWVARCFKPISPPASLPENATLASLRAGSLGDGLSMFTMPEAAGPRC